MEDGPLSPGGGGLLDEVEEEDEAALWAERPGLPDDDDSLKTTLCFRSSRPFDWCRAIPSVLEARALMARQMGGPQASSANEEAFRCAGRGQDCERNGGRDDPIQHEAVRASGPESTH